MLWVASCVRRSRQHGALLVQDHDAHSPIEARINAIKSVVALAHASCRGSVSPDETIACIRDIVMDGLLAAMSDYRRDER